MDKTALKKLKEACVIKVKDKQEILKAAELFDKVGIYVFSSEKSKNKFIESETEINNNFLIKDNDESGWRIQSHFITEGTSIEKLEKIINEVISDNPNIKNKEIRRNRRCTM